MVLGRVFVIACVVVLGAAARPEAAQNPPVQMVMQSKLANAQTLLKSVVTSDWGGIDRSAQALSRISEAEIAMWQTPGRPEYAEHARAFLTAVQGLRDAVKRRDMLAAGTHYTALVSSCVQCHAFVRRARVVSLTR